MGEAATLVVIANILMAINLFVSDDHVFRLAIILLFSALMLTFASAVLYIGIQRFRKKGFID